jgi:hypothetical protein
MEFESFMQHVHKLTKESIALNSVVNDFPTHFAEALSKFRVQRAAVDSI